MSTGFLQHTAYWRNYRVENTLSPSLPIRTGDEQGTKEAAGEGEWLDGFCRRYGI